MGLYSKIAKVKRFYYWSEYNIIFIIIDKFTKWGYFIVYIKEILAENIV